MIAYVLRGSVRKRQHSTPVHTARRAAILVLTFLLPTGSDISAAEDRVRPPNFVIIYADDNDYPEHRCFGIAAQFC